MGEHLLASPFRKQVRYCAIACSDGGWTAGQPLFGYCLPVGDGRAVVPVGETTTSGRAADQGAAGLLTRVRRSPSNMLASRVTRSWIFQRRAGSLPTGYSPKSRC
jgi:hypothetical protein